MEGVGQAQLMHHPTRACAERGQLEVMLCEELLELLRVQLLGGAGKDFDRIEAQRRRLRAAGGKIVPKNKRPAARLGHERDGDGASAPAEGAAAVAV